MDTTEDANREAINRYNALRGKYLPHCYYVVGITKAARELVVTAGPYTSRVEAANDAMSFAGHPDYLDMCTLSGASCQGLRSWEDK